MINRQRAHCLKAQTSPNTPPPAPPPPTTPRPLASSPSTAWAAPGWAWRWCRSTAEPDGDTRCQSQSLTGCTAETHKERHKNNLLKNDGFLPNPRGGAGRHWWTAGCPLLKATFKNVKETNVSRLSTRALSRVSVRGFELNQSLRLIQKKDYQLKSKDVKGRPDPKMTSCVLFVWEANILKTWRKRGSQSDTLEVFYWTNSPTALGEFSGVVVHTRHVLPSINYRVSTTFELLLVV